MSTEDQIVYSTNGCLHSINMKELEEEKHSQEEVAQKTVNFLPILNEN